MPGRYINSISDHFATSRSRLAFVGLGPFCLHLADAALRAGNIEIAACYSRTAEKREAFRREYGGIAAESFEQICENPDIQGVVLATPNDLHCEETLALAASGKHVFVEKPLCNNIEEAQRMIEACDAAGVILAVGHQERRASAYRHLYRMIQNGDLGEIHSFQASQCGDLMGKYGMNDWRFDSGQGVGPIHHKGIHKIDLLHYFFGPVEAVSTMGQPLSHNRGMYQTTVTCMRFASGLVGTLHSGFCYNSHRIDIFGQKMLIGYEGHGEMLSTRDENWHFDRIRVPVVDTLVEELSEFSRAIQGQGTVEIDGRGGAEAVAVAHAALLASQRESDVFIDELRPAGWGATTAISTNTAH